MALSKHPHPKGGWNEMKPTIHYPCPTKDVGHDHIHRQAREPVNHLAPLGASVVETGLKPVSTVVWRDKRQFSSLMGQQ